jgi:hypothetical protein
VGPPALQWTPPLRRQPLTGTLLWCLVQVQALVAVVVARVVQPTEGPRVAACWVVEAAWTAPPVACTTPSCPPRVACCPQA